MFGSRKSYRSDSGDSPAEKPPARPKTPEEQQAALMEYALRALSARALSAAELRGKLAKRSEDEDQIEAVLERLIELRYLDDSQVARIEGQRRGVGAYRVRARLKQRGVDEELIAETLQARDPEEEVEQARALLERRLSSIRRGNNPKAKAYGLLARRGYGGEVIRRALEGLDWTADAGDESWLGEEDEGN
ncbi:recombination regulator RecX [Deinococcus detaillensis]|uniref:Regulatory protein RecX n=1 Tax=Deinococcus detaillensis TaxID=2592048 RepID=A0A553V6E7_9DEIO|nr:RecX family transcriptional regulator [Deinococcus detaillensis]TSA88004.1 recombination regulator RecX [Deinococcus detaillensis]